MVQNQINLPIEILEKIFINCDGKTLLTLKGMNVTFESIVNYLTEKTLIWKWCCEKEIPENEMIEYEEKYHQDNHNKYLSIYCNWAAWSELKHLKYDINRAPINLQRISCISVLGDYVAVGSDDGRVRIFNKRWNPIYEARHLAVKIQKVTFIESSGLLQDRDSIDLCLVVAYHKGLMIIGFDGTHDSQMVIHDVKSYSIYKDYMCYEKPGGRVYIVKIDQVNDDVGRQLVEIWFSRFYSTNSLSCMKMWNGFCKFLLQNEIKSIGYITNDAAPNGRPPRTCTKLKFSYDNDYDTQILRNEVLVNLYKSCDEPRKDLIEFFILGDRGVSKKMFSTWDIFNCFITCIFLYGNTLILGVDIGNIYLYHVSSWKNLDLREYDLKIIVGKHPIISIDVKEQHNERKLFVASQFNIHEITGYSDNFF